MAQSVARSVSGRTSVGDTLHPTLSGQTSTAYLDLPGDLSLRLNTGASRRQQRKPPEYIRAGRHVPNGGTVPREFQRERRGHATIRRWPNTVAWAFACGTLGVLLQIVISIN
jgi:hypothetical protein